MGGGRIVVDGLWRCLCPSVDTIALYRALNPPCIPRNPSRSIPRGKALHTSHHTRLQHGTPISKEDFLRELNDETSQEVKSRPQRTPKKKLEEAIGNITASQGFSQKLYDQAPQSQQRAPKNHTRLQHGTPISKEDFLRELNDETSQAVKRRPQRTPEKKLEEAIDSIAASRGFPQDLVDQAPQSQQHAPNKRRKAMWQEDTWGQELQFKRKLDRANSSTAISTEDFLQEFTYEAPQKDKERPRRAPKHELRGEVSCTPIPEEVSFQEWRWDSEPPRSVITEEYLQRKGNKGQYSYIPTYLLSTLPVLKNTLRTTPTSTIYEALRELRVIEGTYHRVANLVKYLVSERSEKPNAILYECLILANVDKTHGSAKVVANLLDEMSDLRIEKTSGIYHGVLDVLAIHPDYRLRNEVLNEMKQKWVTQTAEDEQSIAVGLLRDGQYERALDKLEELNKLEVYIPEWLYEIYVLTLAEANFHQEAFEIIQHRTKVTDISNSTWYFLLEVFSRDNFHEGVKFICKAMVEPGIINPSDGTLIDILNTAARAQDTDLATGATQLLSTREVKLDYHHYEPLLECYSSQNDLWNSLLVLCIMHQAGVKPTPGSTRSIYQLLRSSPENLETALGTLSQLKHDYNVPIAAFNVVLEGTLHHQGIKAAFSLYQGISKVCTQGPDVTTFHLLLSGCKDFKSLKFLYDEMRSFSIKPDETAYDRIIYLLSVQTTLDQAFETLEEMNQTSAEWWISRETALSLVKRCLAEEDHRVNLILDESSQRGLDLESDVEQLAMETRLQKGERALQIESKESIADAMTESMYG